MALTSQENIHIIQDFNVPPSSVFSFFSDHNRLSEIYPALIKLIMPSSDPTNINGIGSTRAIMRFPIMFTETITRYQEPSIIEYKITFGGGVKNHRGFMQFYPLDNGERTRLDYLIEFEPLLPLTGFFLKLLNKKVVWEAVRELAKRFDENPNY